jgi:hypothetical protein
VLPTYDLHRLSQRDGIEVARKPANPQECRLGCELRQSTLDLVGCFVFVVPVGDYEVFPSQLLTRGHRMQDQMLQSRRLLCGVRDVQHLIILSLAGAVVAKGGVVLPEVGHGKDCVCALKSVNGDD